MAYAAMDWAEWRAQAHRIDTGGLQVATYDLGDPDGAVVTYCHGYPASSHDIAGVVDRLGDGHRVLALDFPGFGASDKPAGHTYSIHACADAVEAVWQDRGTGSTLLVAHDYGVSVAQELLARRGEGGLATELTGVVWMNGGIYPDLHRPTAGQQMLLDPDHGAEVAAAIDADLFAGGVQVTWGTRTEMDPQVVHEMWRSMDDGGGTALMHDLLHYVADRRTHEARWRHALEGNDLPTTFVWGDLDPVSGAHMIERVQERIPAAEVVRMADVGHWPPLEAPDEVAAAIAQMSP